MLRAQLIRDASACPLVAEEPTVPWRSTVERRDVVEAPVLASDLHPELLYTAYFAGIHGIASSCGKPEANASRQNEEVQCSVVNPDCSYMQHTQYRYTGKCVIGTCLKVSLTQAQGPTTNALQVSKSHLHHQPSHTHLLDQPLRNRMERQPMLPKHLHRKLLIRPCNRAEQRPAELHAPAHDPRPVRADDPLCRGGRELLRRGRRGVEQRDLVEAPAQLRIWRAEETVESAEVLEGRVREGCDRLDALEEGYCGTGSRE